MSSITFLPNLLNPHQLPWSRLRDDLNAQSSELLSLQQRLRDATVQISEIESKQLPNELEHVKVVLVDA